MCPLSTGHIIVQAGAGSRGTNVQKAVTLKCMAFVGAATGAFII